MKNISYRQPAAVIAVSALFVLLQLSYFEANAEVDSVHALGHGSIVLFALAGLFIVQRLRDDREVYPLLMLGLSFFYFYELAEMAGEFLKQPEYFKYIFVDILDILSIIFLIFGSMKWVNKRNLTEKITRESEAKYRGVVEASLDAIASVDKDGRILLWNKAAQKVFGYDEADVLGRDVTILMPEEYREKHKAGVKRYLDTGVPKVMGKSYEAEGLAKDGKRVQLEISLFEEKLENRKLFTAIIRDITERKKADEAIKKHASELEEANKLKDLFTDIMRHDLLNPAGTIRNFSELLTEEANDEKRKEIIATIRSNTERLIEMIESASMYARLESAEKLDRVKLDLSEVWKTVMLDFKPLLEQKNMKLGYLAKGECFATANSLIENVFSNLLSNAVKYSPAGKKIEVDVIDENEHYRIYVKDWGPGISAEDKPKLFTRFKRVDKKGVKGTGLGLAIVKRIVELHKGKVWIEDNPEGGSIFYVEIPKQ